MKQYCYVLVCTDGSECWTRALAQSGGDPLTDGWEEGNLSLLLRAGWRPVRETPMGGDTGYAFSLLLLERE